MTELAANTNDQKFYLAILQELRSINERLALIGQPRPRKPREPKPDKPATKVRRPRKPPIREG
jgi:hypothetical protein